MYYTLVVYFHFVINWARFRKNCFLCLFACFRLVILLLLFFCLLARFFSNIKFSNRSNSIICINHSYLLRQSDPFLAMRIACFTWNTFLCLSCCFTSFSSLKLYINDPKIKKYNKYSFSSNTGARFDKQILVNKQGSPNCGNYERKLTGNHFIFLKAYHNQLQPMPPRN